MSKVIVSIVSEQTIPNYIFIKEIFEIGDELLFITSKKMEVQIEPILSTLKYTNCKTSIISLQENEEEKWIEMNNRIKLELDKNKKYIINLTGGTKFMIMAVLHVFETFNSSFYYIPFPKNIILQLNEKEPIPLNYNVNIKEYLSLYNVLQNESSQMLVKNEEFTNSFFNSFITGEFTVTEWGIIDKLRTYRNKGIKDIDSVEKNESSNSKKPQIEGLRSFVEKYNFINSSVNILTSNEIKYITGGWFEEYIYIKIKKDINPTDISIGVKIKREQNPFLNDLDVVFTLGNKLFVIECKTGISETKILIDTVYKAVALKEYLFGLSGNTFIFSLGHKVEDFEIIAKNLGITYYDRSYFIDEIKWREVIDRINEIAKVQ